MKRIDVIALSGILAFAILLASLLVRTTAYQQPVNAATTAAVTHMSVVIATPDMMQSDVGPAFIPGDLTLPGDTYVTVTVTNFDDATALAPGTEKYARATGTVGALTIEALDPSHPNAPGTRTTAMALDPATGVSHTLTIPALGINVPIAPKSRTTFTVRTTTAGKYDWQCFDPCGGGPAGWDGAMATPGFMKGKVMVCGGCGAGGSGCC